MTPILPLFFHETQLSCSASTTNTLPPNLHPTCMSELSLMFPRVATSTRRLHHLPVSLLNTVLPPQRPDSSSPRYTQPHSPRWHNHPSHSPTRMHAPSPHEQPAPRFRKTLSKCSNDQPPHPTKLPITKPPSPLNSSMHQ